MADTDMLVTTSGVEEGQSTIHTMLDLLSVYEDTPFATPPAPAPLGDDLQLAIVQQKIHALAIRAYTAENSLSRRGPPAPATRVPVKPQDQKTNQLNEIERMVKSCMDVSVTSTSICTRH